MSILPAQLAHSWDVSPAEAVAIQQQLRSKVQQTDALAIEAIRTIAGIDASYKDVGWAAVMVLSFPDLVVLERAVASRRSVFPYVPGLLSFRELPVVLDALAKLRTDPDVLMLDGQGIAHPRRFGLASHLGVYLDRPTIGCAKSRLVGSHAAVGPAAGDSAPLVDRGETIGIVLRSKANSNPLYISVGNKLSLPSAVEIVRRCLRGYRLPEPTRLADVLAGQAQRGELPPDLVATAPVRMEQPGQATLFDDQG